MLECLLLEVVRILKKLIMFLCCFGNCGNNSMWQVVLVVKLWSNSRRFTCTLLIHSTWAATTELRCEQTKERKKKEYLLAMKCIIAIQFAKSIAMPYLRIY